MIGLDPLLRRERIVITGALAVMVLLAGTYIWQGAGMGMSAIDMTTLTLFPHTHPEPGMNMPPVGWMTVVVMWWAMMIAMMTPSAAPIVLLYGRVLRQRVGPRQPEYAAPIILVAGYLTSWLGFSIAAATLQFALLRLGVISAALLGSRSAVLSAAVLFAAGVYQLAPLKRACLSRCRGPLQFLMQYWRPGRGGAFVMGVRHGAWCVGCCWLLMVLLFVGGVMNIAWIAILALLVILEKIAPGGVPLSRVAGVVLILWSAATLLVS